MAQVAEVDKSFLLDKENVKLDKDTVHNETIKVVSGAKELDKGDGNNASNANIPTDAVDEWPAVKQIHSFYFVRYRLYDDSEIKAKIDQADKELQKWNRTRFKITDELKAQRSDRAELLSQVRALNVDFDQFKEILGEKKKEIEPLQQALRKLRTNNYAFGGLCSSEEELNAVIHCLQYRIQHESIPLAEEKQLLREIKRLEGTREMVLANAAMRAKIQDSMGQKEAIQDQIKLMGGDLNGVRKEQHAVQSKKKQIKDKLNVIEKRINILQEELKDVTEKRDKAYETIQELRKQRDEENVYFFQSRSLLNKAKFVAAKKDMKALEELAAVEAEKFMSLWNGDKAFRDDYEKRILTSLDSRQLSRDGRIRNPDEKPLEEAKSSPQPGTKKKVQKDADTKVMESKSSPENVVAEKEISGSGKSEDTSASTKTDAAKLKEKKREEEIAKAKQALERKKKMAEKAAAKAAIRAQKEAEKKLKEIICFSLSSFEREKKARKKAAASSSTAVNPEEPTEPEAEASESEKVDVNADAPVPAPVSVKDKAQKESTFRYRNRTKGPEALPRAILRRKKSTNYWSWAAPAALVVLILLALIYYYYLV
ncbi:Proton pump interactor 1 isoform 3 [Hibiscus syriacus]|uniref:Proton pump interactor 1 isoform 3 n=1 Tax=Hibiscus syriacus TaxID=106335 RepID=A0A6A3AFD2_HIBSY|nr:Proton pump interactor 1 isoform 3 [Hibiscus syriacus]